MLAFIIVVVVLVLVVIASGIRVVRPTHRGLVERLGKYNRYSDPGFHVIIPIIERITPIAANDLKITPAMREDAVRRLGTIKDELAQITRKSS